MIPTCSIKDIKPLWNRGNFSEDLLPEGQEGKSNSK